MQILHGGHSELFERAKRRRRGGGRLQLVTIIIYLFSFNLDHNTAD